MRKRKEAKNQTEEKSLSKFSLSRGEKENSEKEEVALSDCENPGKTEETLEEDIALFHELFPGVKAKEIPEEVWERVEQGESLSAAYALYTVETMRKEEKIQQVNRENEKKAPPRIRHDGVESEYFSPEAVKAMTRSEIKKNYDAILKSMETWN